MAMTFTLEKIFDLGGSGGRKVVGYASGSCSYTLGGEVLDLSAYFSTSMNPAVTVQPLNSLRVVVATHDAGTASGGKVQFYTTSNGTTAQGFSEMPTTTNVALCNVRVIALGCMAQ
jgi:hypothetical protein